MLGARVKSEIGTMGSKSGRIGSSKHGGCRAIVPITSKICVVNAVISAK